MAAPKPLRAQRLYKRCDPARLGFDTTAEIEDADGHVGQERASEAVLFGIDAKSSGFNIFAVGPDGANKHSIVRGFIEARALQRPGPDDWCYVRDFTDPVRPRVLRLPSGLGAKLRADMAEFVDDLDPALSAAFESEDYQRRRQAVEQVLENRQREGLDGLARKANAAGLAMRRTDEGLLFAPTSPGGKVLSPEDYGRLPADERARIEEAIRALQADAQEMLQRAPLWEREVRGLLRDLNGEVTSSVVSHMLADVRESFAAFPSVQSFLNAVQRDIVSRPGVREDSAPDAKDGSSDATDPTRAYRVNVLLDSVTTRGAPVIYEDNPTYANLCGRVEYLSEMGTLQTDHTLIRPGALHRANGGYLIIDARRLLSHPHAWEGLKRAVKSRVLSIETPAQAHGLVSTVTLEPRPVPLDVKVILVGDRHSYHMLDSEDPDFPDLFKVLADFEDDLERKPAAERQYARVLAGLSQAADLLPIDSHGAARVVEHAARVADHAGRLTTRLQPLEDLLVEADHVARKQGRGRIGKADVEEALNASRRRTGRVAERVRAQVEEGVVLIDTQGEQRGQINGLSVVQVAGVAFGRPTRITAQVRMGRGDVVDIEREVALSGPLHAKGVLILSGFLGGRFATDHPLSLSASLVFEQSYGGVDGDSASSAELYALLSAISGIPIRQSLAVTGSVNQHGAVQAIGGVNEKIEGFFDLCVERGLTGGQGVLIPAANADNLMLRHDVVAACEAGRFAIYPVSTIDQGLELLTGMPAGRRRKDGAFPPASVNGRVARRLEEIARKRSRYGWFPDG